MTEPARPPGRNPQSRFAWRWIAILLSHAHTRRVPEVGQPHRLAGFAERALALLPRPRAALADDLVDEAVAGGEGGAPLPYRVEEAVEGGGEALLDLDVAHFAPPVAALQVLDLVLFVVEGVVVDEHGVALYVAGVGGVDARRVRVHRHHFPLHRPGVVRQEDGVTERFAHLGLAVE